MKLTWKHIKYILWLNAVWLLILLGGTYFPFICVKLKKETRDFVWISFIFVWILLYVFSSSLPFETETTAVGQLTMAIPCKIWTNTNPSKVYSKQFIASLNAFASYFTFCLSLIQNQPKKVKLNFCCTTFKKLLDYLEQAECSSKKISAKSANADNNIVRNAENTEFHEKGKVQNRKE